MECRPRCAACCIVLSISSALPGMPGGKPPFTRCVNLDPASLRCRIWGTPAYPEVCRAFTPGPGSCGASAGEAVALLTDLELLTNPRRSADARESDQADPSTTQR